MTVATAQQKGLKMSKEKNNEVVTIDTTKAEKYIAKYQNVLTRCNKTAWELAKVVHDTVKAKDFVQAFGTMTEYAKALGVDKSSVTKMLKAYERKLYITDTNDCAGSEVIPSDFSLGQIEEMASVDADLTEDFVKAYKINSATPTKTIRECAKAFLKTGEDVEAEAEEVEEMTVEEVNTNIVLTIETNDGFIFTTENTEVIERIKSFINDIIK